MGLGWCDAGCGDAWVAGRSFLPPATCNAGAGRAAARKVRSERVAQAATARAPLRLPTACRLITTTDRHARHIAAPTYPSPASSNTASRSIASPSLRNDARTALPRCFHAEPRRHQARTSRRPIQLTPTHILQTPPHRAPWHTAQTAMARRSFHHFPAGRGFLPEPDPTRHLRWPDLRWLRGCKADRSRGIPRPS